MDDSFTVAAVLQEDWVYLTQWNVSLPSVQISTVIDAFMAGGNDALFKAVEHAEDSKELAVKDLKGETFYS